MRKPSMFALKRCRDGVLKLAFLCAILSGLPISRSESGNHVQVAVLLLISIARWKPPCWNCAFNTKQRTSTRGSSGLPCVHPCSRRAGRYGSARIASSSFGWLGASFSFSGCAADQRQNGWWFWSLWFWSLGVAYLQCVYQDEQISSCRGSLFCCCCLRFALASRKLLRLPWSLQSCNIRELPKHSCRQLCLPYPARLRSEVCRQWTQLQRTSPILSKQMTMILWCQGRSVWLRWQKFEAREVYGERGAQIMHKHAAQASLPVMPFGLALQTALCSSAVGALVEVWPGVAIPLGMTVLTCDASCFSATSYAKLFAEVAHADAALRTNSSQGCNSVRIEANTIDHFCVSCHGWNIAGKCVFPRQCKLMGSSAQLSSGVCRCGSQEVPDGSGVLVRFQRQVLEGYRGWCWWCRFRGFQSPAPSSGLGSRELRGVRGWSGRFRRFHACRRRFPEGAGFRCGLFPCKLDRSGHVIVLNSFWRWHWPHGQSHCAQNATHWVKHGRRIHI